MIGGIEFGGTKCIVAVANNPLDIVAKKEIPTRDPKSTFSDIVSFFNNFKISGLGVGSFGPLVLDSESVDYGLLVTESKKGWSGVNIVRELSSVNSNIFIDTDVNAAALGEYHYGAGKFTETLVYVTVGTGIGVGVLLNGKPHIGNFHLEIGHMLIPNSDNFKGVCEIHRNCWEGLASGPSIHSRWGTEANKLPEMHEAWQKEAYLLAIGLVNIISNHSPDKIIMGGGVMRQKHLFSLIRDNVEELWNEYTSLGSLSKLISEPGLGKDSGIIGSMSLTL
jgi:fructokinase|tara:strand:+ start:179 stop:1015 length:837 start_codon:yes stop_codon:yes gene_type:complete